MQGIGEKLLQILVVDAIGFEERVILLRKNN
jgi:hypothetical protein